MQYSGDSLKITRKSMRVIQGRDYGEAQFVEVRLHLVVRLKFWNLFYFPHNSSDFVSSF